MKGQRSRGVYDPKSSEPFKISRSKIDFFLECPRCFYLDRREGIGRPSGPPFTLNSAVDTLLKQEFDVHRARKEAHPLMKTYGIEAIPAAHEQLNTWRMNFTGIQYFHRETNLVIQGAIDDLWIDEKGNYIVVDYKATAKSETVRSLSQTSWGTQYQRQMEIYQWLLRRNNLPVSSIGYFVYCTGKADREAFDGKLNFDVVVIPCEGNDEWVEGVILKLKKCLDGSLPPINEECEYCNYRTAAHHFEK